MKRLGFLSSQLLVLHLWGIFREDRGKGNHISDDGAGKLVHGLVQGASHVQQVGALGCCAAVGGVCVYLLRFLPYTRTDGWEEMKMGFLGGWSPKPWFTKGKSSLYSFLWKESRFKTFAISTGFPVCRQEPRTTKPLEHGFETWRRFLRKSASLTSF